MRLHTCTLGQEQVRCTMAANLYMSHFTDRITNSRNTSKNIQDHQSLLRASVAKTIFHAARSNAELCTFLLTHAWCVVHLVGCSRTESWKHLRLMTRLLRWIYEICEICERIRLKLLYMKLWRPGKQSHAANMSLVLRGLPLMSNGCQTLHLSNPLHIPNQAVHHWAQNHMVSEVRGLAPQFSYEIWQLLSHRKWSHQCWWKGPTWILHLRSCEAMRGKQHSLGAFLMLVSSWSCSSQFFEHEPNWKNEKLHYEYYVTICGTLWNY